MKNIHSQKTFKELYRKIDKVTRIRYIAANRLKLHQKLSQWVTTSLSVLLIIVPLLQALKVPIRFNEQFLNAVQVFLAVLVLAYSLLLGIENYSSRAEKMQSCGLELSYLAREIFPYIETNHNVHLYKTFSEQYHSILVKYENHDPIDYKLYMLEEGNILGIINQLSIKIYYYLGFLDYVLVSLGSITIISYIFSKEGSSE